MRIPPVPLCNNLNFVKTEELKLATAIQEAYDLFHPKSIAMFATCPVGLIGNDIHNISRQMKKKLGD
jgi:nitrogenase molybdenum-iron protein alpha chain